MSSEGIYFFGKVEDFVIPLSLSVATMVLYQRTAIEDLKKHFHTFIKVALTSHSGQNRDFFKKDMHYKGEWTIFGQKRDTTFQVRNAVWTYTYGIDDNEELSIDITELKEFLGDKYGKVRTLVTREIREKSS